MKPLVKTAPRDPESEPRAGLGAWRGEEVVAWGRMAQVRLFAGLRETAGTGQLEMKGDTVGAVVAELESRFGAEFARRMETARVWRNGREAGPDDPVNDGDELALIPPVSGGTAAFGAMAGSEPMLLAVIVSGLLAANFFGSAALFAAALVTVMTLWTLDMSRTATSTGLAVDPHPILAALVVSVAAFRFELAGLGIGAVLSVAAVMVWAMVRPAARDLTSLASTALAALMVSLGTGSLLIARLSTGGDRKVAGFIIVVTAGTLASNLAARWGNRVIDPSIAVVPSALPAALLVAWMADFNLLGWFFIGLLMIPALIAGQGLGSAFRTGLAHPISPAGGTLPLLDGPLAAAGLFAPLLWVLT